MSDIPKEYELNQSNVDTVFHVKQEFDNWLQVHERNGNRARMQRNFNFYSGVGHKQWDNEALDILNSQNRPAHTFNFTKKIVDLICGQLSQNPFDVYFDPVSRDLVDEFNVVQEIYNYDVNRGRYEASEDVFKRDGLIYRGILKMFIDYKHSPYGNVGVKQINPSFVFEDPYCRSDDVSDMRGVFTATFKTAQQIYDDYGTTNEHLRVCMERNKWSTAHEYNIDKSFDRSNEYFDSVNNMYRVIEFIYTERKKKRFVYNKINGQRIDKFDNKEMQALSEMNFLAMMRLQGDTLSMGEEDWTETRIVTICPGISNDLVLENGAYPLQLGRLPFIFWSAEDLYGEVQGLVDSLTDAQEILNKRESVASYLLGTMSRNNWLVESDAFNNDGNRINKFRNNVSKGGQTFEV
jgi:hypothetical protein